MSDIHKCGVCGLLTGLLRRVMCVGNRRGSSESCYRELGDQDTLVRERFDRDSGSSDSSEPAKISQEVDIDDYQEYAENCDTTDSNTEKPIVRFHSFHKKRRRRYIIGIRNEQMLLDDCYPMQVELLLSRCTTWEFDTHDLDRATGGQCLPVLCMHLFTGYGLIDFFKLLPERCWKLFRSIEESYHATNPYHNSVHAADVTQAIHCFLQQKPILESISRMEIMMVLLAAITHDLDHPGVNQSFLVATNHPLAIIFKEKDIGWNDRPPHSRRGTQTLIVQQMVHDLKTGKRDYTELESTPFKPKPIKIFKKKEEPPESILEHHHWRAAYSCVLQSGIFEHMPAHLPEIKNMLKSLILATDITRQNDYLDVFRKLLENKSLNMELSDHRHMVLQMALKTADISNPGRPWTISKKWSHSVCDEFYAQGDKELKLNLKISNLCDREKDTIPKIQTGFFRYVVMPLFTEWHHYLNSHLSMTMLKNLIHNEANWTKEDKSSSQTSKTEKSSELVTSADMVEDQLETSTNMSGSSEMLIPWGIGWSEVDSERRAPRRGSYSPIRQSKVKEVLRRYSAPFNLFCESRSRSRAKKNSVPECRLREELQGMTVADPAPPAVALATTVEDKSFNIPKDISEAGSSAGSVPAAADNASVSGVLIDFNSPRRALQGYTVQLDSDDEDISSNDKGFNKIGSVIIEESSISSTSAAVSSSTGPSCGVNGFSVDWSANQGLLLSSANTTSALCSENRLDLQLDKDIPTSKTVARSCEVITFTSAKEKTASDEIKDVLFPQLCISDLYHRRRGSAPAPIAVSDLQRLASNLSLQLGRRKNSASSCHILVAEEAPAVGSARRGSLPVEVMTGISA